MKYWDSALEPAYGSRALAALRFAGFVVMILLMAPAHMLYTLVRPHDRYRLPLFFHRLLARLVGLRIRVHGTMVSSGPVFFVANHVSYLDIPVLGSLLPAAFIAKSDVAAWPVFGFLARIQGTVFIERRSSRAAQQRDRLTQYLAAERSLILFPEGTSSDGQTVLPFKSSLFSAIENVAQNTAVMIQPVSIACTAVDGLPVTQNLRHLYGWYGDMQLIPHMWQAFKCAYFTVDVVFHAPIDAGPLRDRKQIAALCHEAVAGGVERCVTGRWLQAQTQPVLISA